MFIFFFRFFLCSATSLKDLLCSSTPWGWKYWHLHYHSHVGWMLLPLFPSQRLWEWSLNVPHLCPHKHLWHWLWWGILFCCKNLFYWILISLTTNLNWPLYQLNVKNAFLHGDLLEEIYIEQPPRFVAQGEYQGNVCKLKKELYGLKQSPWAWFDKFSDVVMEFSLLYVRPIIQYSICIQMLGIFFLWFMWMTLWLLEIILEALLD